jgi:DNA-binding transcriptional LysR family regulator
MAGMPDAVSPLDPRLLHAFTLLAEELHFGRAARRLHVAQPAISQQLQRLEAQLGVRLFERSRHHVELTKAGEAILPYARQAIAAASAVRRAARSAGGDADARLRVGLSPGAHYLAERVLARLAEADSRVRVQAITDNTGTIARHVADGRLEIALGFASAATPGVCVEGLTEAPAVVAVACTHRLAGKPTVRLHELADQRFAGVDPYDGAGYNDAVRALCRSAGFEPHLSERSTGPMAWETAVRSNGCVGLTTRMSAASTLRGISTVPLAEGGAFRIDLLTPETAGDSLSPAAQRFAAAARTVVIAGAS